MKYNVSIVICSMGRSDVLEDTLASVAQQSLAPIEILLSVTQETDVAPVTRTRPSVRVLLSSQGSCVQRNRAIREVSPAADLVCFLDDDVELHPDYFANLAAAFGDPSTVLATGRILADGCNNVPITRPRARDIMRTHLDDAPNPPIESTGSAYGCNMCIRASCLTEVEFDEHLALYGWLEDCDFSLQCSRLGRIVQVKTAAIVHLGALRGRVSGLRFGFSQIMNPLYLLKKGTLPSLYCVIAEHWSKILISNVVYSLFGDPYVDRPGRLRGNLVALRLICRGTISPEYVRELP